MGGYFIDYSNVLLEEDGSLSGTPARIVINTEVIEVSKMKMMNLTFSERLVILFHEFSHLHRNQDIYNELEADLNGLEIYLSNGFPRIEAIQTYTKTFSEVDSDANLERFVHINNFVDNFENLNTKQF